MENLPAEWKDKIDRVETMTNMDGSTTRVVAIEKLSDEDIAAGKTESRLRVLQWDEKAKGWVSYIPQVGWAGYGPITSDGHVYTSLWDEGLVLPDMETLKEPLKLADGNEVPMGYLGKVYMTEDKQGDYVAFAQGYILDVRKCPPLGEGDKLEHALVYVGIPLEIGDWEVYVAVQQDYGVDIVLSLETLEMSDFGKFVNDTKVRPAKPGISLSKLRAVLIEHGQSLVGEPIIMGLSVVVDRHDDYVDALDQEGFITALQNNEPSDLAKIRGDFSTVILPQSMWAILSQ
jgi:hypothetical protein